MTTSAAAMEKKINNHEVEDLVGQGISLENFELIRVLGQGGMILNYCQV